MKILALSDLHGYLPDLATYETIDAIVIAGDICPDEYPRKQNFSLWDKNLARVEQTRWLHEVYAKWEETWPASVRIALATPGNHDWVTSLPNSLRTKLYVDELVEAYGKRFYFTPWVDICGNWNYQLPRDQRALRFADIPDKLDVLVSHGPAHDVLDKVMGAYGDHVGCHELRKMVQQKQPRFMVHGHIHEGQRYGNRAQLGNTTVYNVAVWGDWKPVVFEI